MRPQNPPVCFDRNRKKTEDSLQKQRERANKRERDRTRALNTAYTRLRQRIPSLPSDKTSKIHTLRVTVEYIQFLKELVAEGNALNIDFAVNEDDQINIPATFNSWRTGITQRKVVSNNTNMKMGPSTTQNKVHPGQSLPMPNAFDKPMFNQLPSTSFLPPNNPSWLTEFYSPFAYSSQLKSESPESTASSLGSALGHAITHSQL